MMTNKRSRITAYRWFTTDAYQTRSFQWKIHPFSLVDTENCFPFKNECDFLLFYWPRLGTVLRTTKHFQFPVEKCIFHFDIALCSLLTPGNLKVKKCNHYSEFCVTEKQQKENNQTSFFLKKIINFKHHILKSFVWF